MRAIDLEIGKIYIDDKERPTDQTNKIHYIMVNRFADGRNEIYSDRYTLFIGPRGSVAIRTKNSLDRPTDFGLTAPMNQQQRREAVSNILNLKMIVG